MPVFPPDPSGNPIILVDITGMPEVQESWVYLEETNSFREPTPEDFLPIEDAPLSIEERLAIAEDNHIEVIENIVDIDFRLVTIEINSI